jgi:hypothetical protein
MKKENKNKFKNDQERINELKSALKEAVKLLEGKGTSLFVVESNSDEKKYVEKIKNLTKEEKAVFNNTITMQTRTFIRDVLSRYEQDLKFATAGTYFDKDFPELRLEMLDD